jgi:MFS family permease
LSIPTLFAPIMGPPIGGFITTYYHWRGIFWLNVPVGLLGLVMASLVVPAVKAEQLRPIDLKGFALTSLGLSLTIFGVTLAGSQASDSRAAWAMTLAGIALLVLYGLHARRTEHPIIELRLLRIVTFRTAMAGGILFRLAVGAIPFLLPMMLQLGFGLSPFESGSLTFAAALGALTMKLTAAPILRRFGFRTILWLNAVLSSVLLAASALFSASTPHAVIILVLLTAGFFRSLQFTSLNTLGYADVAHAQMSQATSLVGVVQQLSLAAGVAVAAMLLDGARSADGRSVLLASDFGFACCPRSGYKLSIITGESWNVYIPKDNANYTTGNLNYTCVPMEGESLDNALAPDAVPILTATVQASIAQSATLASGCLHNMSSAADVLGGGKSVYSD